MRSFAARSSLALLCLVALLSPADARTKRSQSAKVEFKREHPCPANGATKGPCKGYVIDHVKPLCAGGADAPYNMAWQTLSESKIKDNAERALCRQMRRDNSSQQIQPSASGGS